MTLYDSSLLIDYLDGEAGAIQYVEDHVGDRTITVPLVLFEVYQGEVYKTGPPDFDAIDRALTWVSVVDVTAETARAAAELQEHLQQRGETMAARDAFIAGTALRREERLAVSDADFVVDGIEEVLDVDVV